MNAFQIMSVVVLSPLYVLSLWRAFRGQVIQREGLVTAALCLAATVAIVWPEITVKLARLLGIDRGSDLLLYMAVFAMMAGFWITYMRVRSLRSEITMLVRQIALMNAEQPPGESRKG